MKILISACVFGKNVRWNATNRSSDEVKQWADSNGYELVPVCPENELFGTPRKSIRLRQKMTKFWQLWVAKTSILNYKINVKNWL